MANTQWAFSMDSAQIFLQEYGKLDSSDPLRTHAERLLPFENYPSEFHNGTAFGLYLASIAYKNIPGETTKEEKGIMMAIAALIGRASELFLNALASEPSPSSQFAFTIESAQTFLAGYITLDPADPLRIHSEILIPLNRSKVFYNGIAMGLFLANTAWMNMAGKKTTKVQGVMMAIAALTGRTSQLFLDAV